VEIFDIYAKINPNINYGHKTNRQAAIDLFKMAEKKLKENGFAGDIRKKALENVKIIAEFSIKVQGKRFAPVITTPYQLKEKMAQLQIYYEKMQNGQAEAKGGAAVF
jgi:hypothetical protein